MSETKNFLGIPVEGDIVRPSTTKVPQRPKEELGPLLMAVLDVEGVRSVCWQQYTPYFNDGEECVFHAWGIRVSLEADTPNDYDYNDEYGYEAYENKISGGYQQQWDPTTSSYRNVGEEIPRHPVFGPLSDLQSALEGSAFNEAILDAFGDHAAVVVSKNGIVVNYYEHD